LTDRGPNNRFMACEVSVSVVSEGAETRLITISRSHISDSYIRQNALL